MKVYQLKSWRVKHADINLKPHNEGYHINMSLHLHYLVEKNNSLLESLWSLFSLRFHPTKWSWTSFIFSWFDHTWYEAYWNSMIERTKTLIFVDFEFIFKELGKTLLKHLEKRALKIQGRVSQMMILICGWKMNHHSWNPKG